MSQQLSSTVVRAAKDAHAGLVCEEASVALPPLAAPGDHLVQAAQLRPPECGEDVGQSIVVADLGVLVVGDWLACLRRQLAHMVREICGRS